MHIQPGEDSVMRGSWLIPPGSTAEGSVLYWSDTAVSDAVVPHEHADSRSVASGRHCHGTPQTGGLAVDSSFALITDGNTC